MRLYYGDLDLTDFPYAIEFGLDTGAPQNVSEALAFLLQDGEVELSTRASNRTMAFTVQVEGADLAECADAEAALIAETEKPLNTVTIDPEDFGPPSVYEVFRGQVTLARDDNGEMARLRRYEVSVRAYPFVRSATEKVTAALPASGTNTQLVDNGSSATGWTATVNGAAATPTVSSGAVKVSSAAVTGSVTISMTRTGTIDTSTTKYLPVDWRPESPGGNPSIAAYADGVALAEVARYASPTAGFTRSWFYVAAGSVAALRLDSISTVKAEWTSPALVRSLYVDNINRTDAKPSFGSGRQLMRTVAVAGSAPSQGSLAIEHATNALGDVVVYTFPDGDGFDAYSPPLRQYRVAGGAVVTTDTTMVSGAWDNIKNATSTFDVPLANLIPGMHTLVTRVTSGQVSVTSVLTWTAATYINGTQVGPTKSGTSVIPAGLSYTNLAVARLSLPTTDVDTAATNGVVRLTVSADGAAAAKLDEVLLLNTSVGQVTMVSCGTGSPASGGPARRLFLTPATVDRPRPTLRIGDAADRSDSFYPVGAVQAWQFPRFKPPMVRCYTMASNAPDASVSLAQFAAWHTNAAS